MNDETPHVHHRFKLLFFLVCFVTGAAMAIGGALTGYVGLVISGVVVALASLPAVWITVRGRGGSGWLAGERAVTRSAGASRAQRAKFSFVLAASVGFVLAGAALVAVGAERNRPAVVLIGVVGCLFFGVCAWIALAVLRGSTN